MRKAYFILLIIITGLSSKMLAQSNSGEVIYAVDIDLGESAKLDKRTNFNPFRSKLQSTAKKLKFELTFNKKESIFKIVEELAIDKDDLNIKMTISILRGQSLFYANLNENNFLEQNEVFGELVLINKDIAGLSWELTDETKQIGKYLCYRATSVKEGKDRNFQITKTPITAWFCPELPYQFGPFEAIGLPGLVLEYQLNYLIWRAEEIKFSETTYTIKKPEKGKLISEEEIDKIIDKKAKASFKGN